MGFNTKTDSVGVDQLKAGNFPVVTKPVTLSTVAFVRGSVLGIITATSVAVLVDSDAVDGSAVAQGILMDSAEVTTGTKSGIMALTGDFEQGSLTFGGTDVAADHEDALRNKSIFIHKTAKAV